MIVDADGWWIPEAVFPPDWDGETLRCCDVVGCRQSEPFDLIVAREGLNLCREHAQEGEAEA